MPDTYAVVTVYEEHGDAIFHGDQKKAEKQLRMVIEGFWRYFSTVRSLDGKDEAIRMLRFCIRKHGLNSALIAPVSKNLRETDLDAEIDQILLNSRHKRSTRLQSITSTPCDLRRVRQFREGAWQTK